MGPVSFRDPDWQHGVVRHADKCQFDEGFHVGNYVSEGQHRRCYVDFINGEKFRCDAALYPDRGRKKRLNREIKLSGIAIARAPEDQPRIKI